MNILHALSAIMLLAAFNPGVSDMNSAFSIQLTVVYDNNFHDQRLETDWGFSCFIQGLEKSILFDTGADGRILLSNMKKLEISPEEIDVVVLSHAHKDHTGGLDALLDKNPKIEVWLPHFFQPDFKDNIRKKGTRIVEVFGYQNICVGAYTTGVIEGWIKEQALILHSNQGPVVMTGCAHPGIVNILSLAEKLTDKRVYMALGGFHLAGFERREIQGIIEEFRALGIGKVGPCHCSGDTARRLFADEYGKDFVGIGAGRKIKIR